MKLTQIARVAARLIRGEVIDSRGIDKELGSYRAATAHVSTLKIKYEWDIPRKPIKRLTSDQIERFADYTIYWLDEKTIKRFGQEGR